MAREIEDNHFVVRTERPNVKVSWQVTGVRQDPYAEEYRAPVEEEKPDTERGRYLHPKLYGAAPDTPEGRPIGSMQVSFRAPEDRGNQEEECA